MSFLKGILGKLFKKQKWEERRKFIRLSAHHLLKYKVLEKEEKLSFARNISAGGVLFYCKEQLPAGSTVELEVNFPQYPHPIKVVAKVIRAMELKKMGGYEIGAEFINVEEGAKNFIDEKIKAVSKEVKGEVNKTE